MRDQLLTLYSQLDELTSQVARGESTVSALETEIKLLEKERRHLEVVWESLRKLQDMFSTESIGMLQDLLNKGLKSIFTDREYSVAFEISDTKNKKLKMYLLEVTPDGGMQKTDLFSGIMLVGGGVLSVVSFIFQVYLIILYGKRRYIQVDEGFTNISREYIEGFMNFLRYLHTDMGFDFLMIVHDEKFLPFLDRIYRVNMGRVSLVEDRNVQTGKGE